MAEYSDEFRRYNPKKLGSFEVKVWLFDHELSAVVGALREFRKSHEGNKGYCTFLSGLEGKFSTILSRLLKLELEDKKKNLRGAHDKEKEKHE